ncbi:cupin [Streptomyces alfalfae]|uniref:Cupin n=1 Tax=Streptomyces alfalfae TaxID=1642299 RepID=A0ABN4VSI3_9ACTN|nr:cupin [Streptomyces alfalfae]AYA20480.1 cupin [Streptomyces fradiae]APY90017.1 cupin [Streptomyces alfalfae]QUI29906.1 cupin [Streptomyces alfalfae]RXX42845.1 cupin [Streptomyces alfalfae]RZM86327.1 cupin [Streptomyces alfalfae]
MVSVPPSLPGAVGLSHLSAYPWEAADGVCGGSPHLHLVCTEAYVVTGGRGAVQTLGPDGYRDIPLAEGSVAWFTPGTVHRMVQGGELRITVLMQNDGLPEAGDAVFTFPPAVLADPEWYASEARLPARSGPGAERAARRRRDLAVEGYLPLREALQAGDDGPFLAFQRAAARLVRDKVPGWRELWRSGALAAAERTGAQLDALEAGSAAHLTGAGSYDMVPVRRGGYGMCGRRDEYEPGLRAASTWPDASRRPHA